MKYIEEILGVNNNLYRLIRIVEINNKNKEKKLYKKKRKEKKKK
jgi:hypothetical protein